MMKHIKMIAFTLLFVLFAVPQVQAVAEKCNLPVYQNVISEINLKYDGEMLAGDIKLDNGAVMHIVDYKTRDDVAIAKWQPGNVVFFTPHVHKEKLILAIKRVVDGCVEEAVEPCAIFDVIKSSKSALSIVEIRENGEFIKLSDNTVWQFSFLNRYSTEDWKVGQRVLVSGHGDKNSYTFINLDVPLKNNVYSATASFVAD